MNSGPVGYEEVCVSICYPGVASPWSVLHHLVVCRVSQAADWSSLIRKTLPVNAVVYVGHKERGCATIWPFSIDGHFYVYILYFQLLVQSCFCVCI